MTISIISVKKLCRSAATYIESCQLEDGGYFFARIPPSSAMDTYYAIKSLSIMGLTPARLHDIKDFLTKAVEGKTLKSINGLFAVIESFYELGEKCTASEHILKILHSLGNKAGGFGAIENLDIEVVSELETTYRAIKIMNRLRIDFDKKQIADFVLRFNNPDGGFGYGGISTLASTYYATEIFKIIGPEYNDSSHLKGYLNMLRNSHQINYLEEIFWISMIFRNTGRILADNAILDFIIGCQRSNGGFARKDVIGIPTLEDTYYALSALNAMGYI